MTCNKAHGHNQTHDTHTRHGNVNTTHAVDASPIQEPSTHRISQSLGQQHVARQLNVIVDYRVAIPDDVNVTVVVLLIDGNVVAVTNAVVLV